MDLWSKCSDQEESIWIRITSQSSKMKYYSFVLILMLQRWRSNMKCAPATKFSTQMIANRSLNKYEQWNSNLWMKDVKLAENFSILSRDINNNCPPFRPMKKEIMEITTKKSINENARTWQNYTYKFLPWLDKWIHNDNY